MYEMMRAYFSDRHRMRLLQDRLAGGLSESERIFLEAAELGNLDVIKDLLESGKVKVDCCDQQGRTALEMAVTGNDVDIVTYLLERTSARHIHKALLAAADNDMDRICEMILDHPLYKETIRRESMKHAAELSGKVGNEFTQGIDNRFSHANLSKLLLEVLLRAAKRNNFQIVKKIMMCGVCLEEPHDYFCSCADCTEWRKEDFKVFTTRRLDTFTALASPAYISLSAEDPILASFYLSHKFRRLSEIEGEYKNIYDQLDQQVQNFTLALLDQCQSSGEVKAILSGEHKTRNVSKESLDVDNHSNHDEEEGDEDEEIPSEETTLPLVYTAVRMEQKKFIAHPQCQAQIGEMWYSGVPFLRHLNRFAYLMLAIPIGIIVCPLLSMAYLFTPWSKVSRIVKTPLMKFLSYTCSYLTFLILITVVKLYLRHYIDTFSCEAPDTLAYIVILVVFMWISGLILEECKQVFSAGIKNYLASFWNLMDSSMLSFLLASFVLELVTPLRLHKVVEDEEAGDNSTQTGQSAGQYTICQQSKYTAHLSSADFCTLYDEQQLSAHVTWTPTWVPDPELVSDVLFSVGIICSVSRFSFIMPANEALGTMLVSFRRTVSDIIKIFGMFILVMFAFTCGLAALYAPSRCYTNSFDSFSGTLSTLTWSMFSMGDVEWPSLVEGATGPISSLTNNKDRSTGAVQVGNYLYGIYVFCTTIVLLNLLIAVMTNTFEEVQDERDVEWKFARTELWLTFIEPGNLLPPPFNIVPSPRHLWEVIVWLCQRSCSRNLLPDEAKKVRYAYVQTGSSFELNNMDEEDKSDLSLESHHERKDVMSQLIRRYVRHIERLKIEGDSDKTSSEEILRRLIERMNVKVEKRLDEVQHKLLRMEREVGSVREDSSSVRQVQEEHYDKFLQFADHKTHESDRYVHFLDEAKLQILARMDSERIQMERVLDSRIHNLGRKLDDSSIHLAQQIDKLQATKGSGQSSVSPHI